MSSCGVSGYLQEWARRCAVAGIVDEKLAVTFLTAYQCAEPYDHKFDADVCLYYAVNAAGVLKVGISSRPGDRVKSLRLPGHDSRFALIGRYSGYARREERFMKRLLRKYVVHETEYFAGQPISILIGVIQDEYPDYELVSAQCCPRSAAETVLRALGSVPAA